MPLSIPDKMIFQVKKKKKKNKNYFFQNFKLKKTPLCTFYVKNLENLIDKP